MKIRKLLRGIPLLLLAVSGLSLFLNCKGTTSTPKPTFYTVTFDTQGGSAVAPVTVEHGKTIAQPDSPQKDSFTFGGWYKEKACTTAWNFATDTVTQNITLYAKWTVETVTVTFKVIGNKNGTLTAKAGNTALQSGKPVNKGTDVTFTATPREGYEVDYMRVNGAVKHEKSVTIKADQNITVTVQFKQQGTPATEFFTVTYKAEPAAGGSISAKDADGTVVASGEQVAKGTELVLTAVPNTGYDIFTWYGAAVASNKKTVKLTIQENSEVCVIFTLKRYTVTFDAQGGTPVPAAQTVEHGKKIEKPADPVKAPLILGGWYKEKDCKTPWNFSTDTVTADTTLYALWKEKVITVHFDENKMTCYNKDKGIYVHDGDTVYENNYLHCIAKLSEGQLVEKWTINGKEIWLNQDSYTYPVQASDTKITIDCTIKTPVKTAIQFNASKIRCSKNGNTINSGNIVYETEQLYFEAKLPEEQAVEDWTVNGKKIVSNKNWFAYRVQAKDIQNGTITVDCTVRQRGKATLTFDENKITCYKNKDSEVHSGNTVYEHEWLSFKATLPAGKIIEKWIINDKEEPPKGDWFGYEVQASDRNIHVDYRLK